jgi:hypothetical protein
LSFANRSDHDHINCSKKRRLQPIERKRDNYAEKNE